jgi:hypothetical protein
VSFCFLLNAVLLFAGVVTFIIAGFAGTFSRRLHACRYRLMLAPLGFVVLGSISYSTTSHLIAWFTQANPGMHLAHIAHAGLGSSAEIFESGVLILAGFAGVLTGIAVGSAFDQAPTADQTYTIANYWTRHGDRSKTGTETAGADVRMRKAKVIAISTQRRQPDPAHKPKKMLSENE